MNPETHAPLRGASLTPVTQTAEQREASGCLLNVLGLGMSVCLFFWCCPLPPTNPPPPHPPPAAGRGEVRPICGTLSPKRKHFFDLDDGAMHRMPWGLRPSPGY
ncbi:hypothetical protein Q8A67_009383 [Cirrhinus molitorella]|uniref:Uncharacterized protein n=1 Tax=Cirrhinus molitorella TaxID=172907 RepID=A0AA88PUG6_9TELE|nr:hypothetical protein Q8A67_009383 [Cirrhinus molitorella]